MSKDTVLRMNNMTKKFPGVLALDDVSIHLNRGEVLCLLGENGAGKSTLLKILTGAYQADEGTIELLGDTVNLNKPSDALKRGIAVMYQELTNVPPLSIAENIFLGRQPATRFGSVDWGKMRRRSKRILQEMGVELDPRQPMESLSIAEQQLVEIAKAVSQEMDILVTDEPTSSLNDQEVERLFEVLDHLRSEGVAIIFISHKLEEVMEIGDRVVVLRDGVKVGEEQVEETSRRELVKMMVGRDLEKMFPDRRGKPGKNLLEAQDLKGDRLEGVSLNLQEGEILGVFGLLGSGIHELGEALTGKSPPESGKIMLEGEGVTIDSPKSAINSKIAFVPRDKQTEGLVLGMNVAENISLPRLFVFGGNHVFLDNSEDKRRANNWIEELNIKTPSVETIVKTLSGGNQQKVVLSKWLDTDPKLLVLLEPTRGIDVGAKTEIYELLRKFCDEGVGVLFISSELPEILGVSDRIIVMNEGRRVEEFRADKASKEDVMHAAV